VSDELQVNLKLKHQSSQTVEVGAIPAPKWGKNQEALLFSYQIIAVLKKVRYAHGGH
jgi:hypothetical protein